MFNSELVKDSESLIEYRYFCDGDRTREGQVLFDKEVGKIASLDKAEGDGSAVPFCISRGHDRRDGPIMPRPVLCGAGGERHCLLIGIFAA